jgi:ribosomal protein S18 acetylase RimI-like enzyme
MKITGKGTVTIRPLAYRDVNSVLGLWWSSFITKKELVASQLGGRLDLSFIAELGGHLVGFILARIEYVGIPMTEVCVIHAVAVEPNYRRQGIGSLLINKLKSHCAGKGIPTMRALVSQDDSELLNYFKRLGFHGSNITILEQSCGG